MAQDFAKRKQNTGSKKAAAQKTQARRNTSDSPSRGNGFKLYFAGVLTGVFLSFLGYLGTLPDPADPAKDTKPAPQVEIPKPRFEFYTMLPKQTLDGEDVDAVEPAADVSKPPTAVAAPGTIEGLVYLRPEFDLGVHARVQPELLVQLALFSLWVAWQSRA